PKPIRANAPRNQIGAIAIQPIPGLLKHVIDSPGSHFTEAIRSVKIGAGLSGAGKVIGVTSSLPNEGKSTIAMCLAQLSTQSGAQVILVDCDLRKRSLSQQLAPRSHLGLIDVVVNAANLDDVILFYPVTNLSFLPAGVGYNPTHTSEILASDAMKRMIDQLRESYDHIIIDLPPIAPVVDVRATTHFLDCYLFVIEWGKTRVDVVEHSFNSAQGIYDNLLGVVLNKVDFGLLGRYEGHRYDYAALYGDSYGYISTSRDHMKD
ncbi:MAG: CpsD/CapB family tyrosine-protein kinase, partial [Xanthobacteraceae bacterium]